jgi:hypothetical protein
MKRIAFGFIALVSLAAPARAEIAFGESIEWVTADADRVIVGRVIKVEMRDKQEVAVVEVSQTIRGKHEPTVKVFRHGKLGAKSKEWLDAGAPVMFFLRSNASAWILRDDHNFPSVIVLGKTKREAPRSMDVFTRDFGMLTEPDAILKHVEAYAKSIPADWKKQHIMLDAPGSSAVFRKLWGGSTVLLKVPVDPQLDTQGRRWCKSADPDQRVHGVQALAKFKNDENIKLLKSLLQDPAFSTGDGMRRYYVRRNAFEALRGFGVEVARPVLEELDKEN